MGLSSSEVRASGGGGRSALWRQMQADMFDTDIVTINSSEGGALGVALLAGVGTGVYKSVPEACDTVIKAVSRQKPNKGNADVYRRCYPVYRNLYAVLKQSFRDIGDTLL
jgi:xylulokinase